MDLNCLTVPSARLMFSEFLEWLAEPARSSLPHFEGAQFSVKGFSATGPGKNWADAEPPKAIRIELARMEHLIAKFLPMWLRAIAINAQRRARPRFSHALPCVVTWPRPLYQRGRNGARVLKRLQQTSF